MTRWTLFVIAFALRAQSLRVYSEFQRIDPFGNIVKADRGGAPREVLSPMAARDAWISFNVALTVPANSPCRLLVQQNPEALRVEVYRELYVKTGSGWIPDALEKVDLPYEFSLPGTIPGQTTVSFWLDVWVPAKTPPGRIRLEVLAYTGGRWLTYPMEVRVSAAAAPKLNKVNGALPPVTARADAALRACLCGSVKEFPAPALSIRRQIRRNAAQDLALAGGRLPEAVVQACRTRNFEKQYGAEWFLKIRDSLRK